MTTIRKMNDDHLDGCACLRCERYTQVKFDLILLDEIARTVPCRNCGLHAGRHAGGWYFSIDKGKKEWSGGACLVQELAKRGVEAIGFHEPHSRWARYYIYQPKTNK